MFQKDFKWSFPIPMLLLLFLLYAWFHCLKCYNFLKIQCTCCFLLYRYVDVNRIRYQWPILKVNIVDARRFRLLHRPIEILSRIAALVRCSSWLKIDLLAAADAMMCFVRLKSSWRLKFENEYLLKFNETTFLSNSRNILSFIPFRWHAWSFRILPKFAENDEFSIHFVSHKSQTSIHNQRYTNIISYVVTVPVTQSTITLLFSFFWSISIPFNRLQMRYVHRARRRMCWNH